MLSFIKDILFPKFCFGCGLPGNYICIRCSKNIKSITFDICPYCRKQSALGLTHPRCKKRYGLDGLKSFFFYKDITKRFIKEIKYKLVKEAFYDVFQVIPHIKIDELFKYKLIAQEWIILPVPLHKKRLNQRGFNQSDIIAEHISAILHMPVDTTLIKRTRYTQPQAELKIDKRYENIKGAFSIDKKVFGNYIIVDDVFTSGHTIFEMVKLLKKNGARRIIAITLAR